MKCSYIVIHHSATEPEASVEDIRAAHRARGFIDIGYHYLIHPDGTVAAGRPEHLQGAHARGLNAQSLGICCIGNFETTQPDPRQVQALTDLVILLTRRYAVAPHRIIGHRDVMRISPVATVTVCPGIHLARHIPQIRSKALCSLLADNGYDPAPSLHIPEDQQPILRSQPSDATGDQAAFLYLVRSLSDLALGDGEGIHPLDLCKILRACHVNVTVLIEQPEASSQDQEIISHLESLDVAHRALTSTDRLEALERHTLCLIQGYQLGLRTINCIRELFPHIRVAIHASTLGWLLWREARAIGTSNTNDSKAAANKALELSAYLLADEVWLSSNYEQVSLQAELPQVKTRTIGRLCHSTISDEHRLGDRILCLADFSPRNRQEDAGWLEELLTALQARSPHTLPLDIAGEDPPESIRRLAKAAGVSLSSRYVPSQPCPRLALAPIWPGITPTQPLRSLLERGIPLMTNTHGNARLGLRHGHEILVADTAEQVLQLLTQVQSGVFDLEEMRRCALRHISLECSQQSLSQLLLASVVTPRVAIAVQSRSDGRYLQQCLHSLCANSLNPHPQIVIFNQAHSKLDLQPLRAAGAEVSFAEMVVDATPLGICRTLRERYAMHDIVLVDDDIVVQHSGWLRSLVDCAYSAAQVIASCGMITNTKQEIVEAGAEMNLAGYSNLLARSKPVYCPEASSHRVVGFGPPSLLYLRRDALDLFADFEPSSSIPLHQVAELQYRAHTHGWSTRYTPLCIATALAADFSYVETPKETLDAGGFRSAITDTSFEEYNG